MDFMFRTICMNARSLQIWFVVASLLSPSFLLASPQDRQAHRRQVEAVPYNSVLRGGSFVDIVLKAKAIQLNPSAQAEVASLWRSFYSVSYTQTLRLALGIETPYNAFVERILSQHGHHPALVRFIEDVFARMAMTAVLAKNGYWDLVPLETRALMEDMVIHATALRVEGDWRDTEKARAVADVMSGTLEIITPLADTMTRAERERFSTAVDQVMSELASQRIVSRTFHQYLMKNFVTLPGATVGGGLASATFLYVATSGIVLFLEKTGLIYGIPDWYMDWWDNIGPGTACLGGLLSLAVAVQSGKPVLCVARKRSWFSRMSEQCQRIWDEQKAKGLK